MERREDSLETAIQPGHFLLQSSLNEEFSLSLRDTEVGAEDVEEGEVGHGAAVVEAMALKIGVVLIRQRAPEFQKEAGLADTRFAHDADDLAGAGLRPIKGFLQSSHLLLSSDEASEAPCNRCLNPGSHFGRFD